MRRRLGNRQHGCLGIVLRLLGLRRAKLEETSTTLAYPIWFESLSLEVLVAHRREWLPNVGYFAFVQLEVLVRS